MGAEENRATNKILVKVETIIHYSFASLFSEKNVVSKTIRLNYVVIFSNYLNTLYLFIKLLIHFNILIIIINTSLFKGEILHNMYITKGK